MMSGLAIRSWVPLARFLATRGHPGPQFSANNLIDDVSFTAAHLRAITGRAAPPADPEQRDPQRT